MIVTAWRIVKSRYVRAAFDGEGARLAGGRWNSKGVPLVYTASSQSLAILEVLVHMQTSQLPADYRLVSVGFDDSLVAHVPMRKLPSNWLRTPAPARLRDIGDAWATSRSSPVLRVPSAIVPAEPNYLLNPLHPAFAELKIGKPQAFRFDPRLAKER